MNRYWMEDTYGKYGVALEGYGPYLLPGTQDEYFITDFTAQHLTATPRRERRRPGERDRRRGRLIGELQRRQDRAWLTAGPARRPHLNRVVTAIPDATHLRRVRRARLQPRPSPRPPTSSIEHRRPRSRRRPLLAVGFDDRLETRTITVSRHGRLRRHRHRPRLRRWRLRTRTNTILRDMTTTAIATVRRQLVRPHAATATTATTRSSPGPTTSRRPSAMRTTTRSMSPPARTRAAPGRNSARCSSPSERPVPDELGPPNPEIPQNWAATRYIPWTSWRSAATIWPSASGTNSIEGEGSGMAVYAHELTHNLGIADNYNNPYAAPFQRAGHRLLEHDEPRLVRRAGRNPQPLAHPVRRRARRSGRST